MQAGTVWQKFETVSGVGLRGQGSPEILAGIGKATQADVVRLLWPTGVVQDEVELKANTRHAITQIDRRGSSCPVLFSWNGERYEFIADAIGPAVVGHWVAPDTRNISDVDELVKVEGRQVREKGRPRVVPVRRADGGSDLPRSGEALRDRSSRRHRRLPERVLRRDAAAPGRSADRLARRAAAGGRVGRRGARRDGGARKRDRRFVDIALSRGGRASALRTSFKGFAPLHSLELDLGELPAGAPVRLLMHGFTDYFTATSVFAAHQANVTAVRAVGRSAAARRPVDAASPTTSASPRDCCGR